AAQTVAVTFEPKPIAAPPRGDEEISQTIKLGKPGTTGNLVWTIRKVSKPKRLTAEYSETLEAQGFFVIVEGTIRNRGRQSLHVGSGSLTVIDDKGREFEALEDGYFYVLDNKSFIFEQINPGLKRQWQVIFEVPKNAKGLLLRVGDGELFSDKNVIIDLGE
ncbi:MAG: DUF4352 domain-containing protein, partial [Chloroflexia bacterium]|nr:DUF4352 domain-containing protein [Chloroflexia bacterium]